MSLFKILLPPKDHPTFKQGGQPFQETIRKSPPDMQGEHDPQLKAFLNAQMEHYRNLENFLVKINRLPQTRNYRFNMATWTTATATSPYNVGVITCQLQSQPIRGIFVENYSTAQTINIFDGPTGAGVVPLIVSNGASFHRMPVDEIFTVSFVPVNATGYFRLLLSEVPFSPAMGATI